MFNKKWFSLIEIMLWIIIFSIIIVAWFDAMWSIVSWKIKLVEKADINKEAYFFSERLFEEIKKWWTIDYEEYFNRRVVWTTTNSWYYSLATWFWNYWNWWSIWTSTYWSGMYYCLSSSWSSMWNKWCFLSYNTDWVNFTWKPQRYSQYFYQHIDYNSNMDWDKWDEDDDSNWTVVVWTWNTSLSDTGIVFHYDMSTTTWGLLKDLWPNWNNWKCFNLSNAEISCWNTAWPIISNKIWNNWNSMFFSWARVRIESSVAWILPSKPLSFVARVMFNRKDNDQLIYISNNINSSSSSDNRYLFYSTRRSDWNYTSSTWWLSSHLGTVGSGWTWGSGRSTSQNTKYFDIWKWYNIVWVVNTQSWYIKVYRDGYLIQINDFNTNPYNFFSTPKWLSLWWDRSWYESNIYIDEFRLYNRALTEDEISTLSE